MQPTPVHHRLPRAGLDPICNVHEALLTVSMAVQRPYRSETIVVLLDDARRGVAIAVVAGTHRPDDVVEVVECLTNPLVHDDRVGAVIVATVRPPGVAPDDPPADGSLPDGHRNDLDRWLEMSDLADQAGVELLEWFVIARGVSCPRDRLGEPPRW